MKGKTVVITGASQGIGASAARIFADAGANVALLARNGEKLAALAGEIGEAALALPCDVSDHSAVAAAIGEVEARFGRVDVLIANAAVLGDVRKVGQVEPQAWADVIDINLKGVFYPVHAVLAGMAARGAGTILTLSSGAAHRALEGWSAYCASKAGVAMLVESLDLEYREAGVRVMGLSPATVATQMQRDIKASGVNPVSELEWSDHVPPEWPAQILLWMCGAGADAYVGREVALRDPEIQKAAGLVG